MLTTESTHFPHKTLQRRRLTAFGLGAAVVLPWVNPVTSGPSPNVWPWLISAACAVVLWAYRRRLDADLVFLALAVAAGASCAMGLLQYFGLTSGLLPWIAHTNPGEAFANLRQRNQFATLTAVGLLALLGWFAKRASMGRDFGPAAWLALPLALGNAVSSSRTGLLQWVLILALILWWNLRARRQVVMLAFQAVTAYLVAAAALPWVLNALTGFSTPGLFGRLLEGPSCASRSVLWSNVLTLITQRPWGGWGWGELDYAHFVTLYPGARFCDILDNAHNLPLHLAVELGIPVALTICTGIVWIIWCAKPWREANPTRQAAWGILAVIGLHSMLEYPLWYGPFQMAFILCADLLWATRGAIRSGAADYRAQEVDNNGSNWLAFFQGALAVALMAILVVAGIDYHRVGQIYLPQAQRSPVYRDDTLGKVRDAWLFRSQADFAELSMTPLKPGNAEAMHALALKLVHYSPEPSVAEKLIESAVMLGKDNEALFYLARYRSAFPEDHARWVGAQVAPRGGVGMIACDVKAAPSGAGRGCPQIGDR